MKKYLLLLLLLPCFSFLGNDNIRLIQIQMLTRTLQNGQYISVKSSLYIDVLKEVMVSHTLVPYEQVAINYSNGDMKVYNVKQNTVIQMNGMDMSSRNSFFYNFLYGSTSDLGLKKSGFKVIQTKTEDKTMVVTTWEPINKQKKGVQKAVLAHENNMPVYLAFSDEKKLTFLKIYYDNYQKVNNVYLPTLMTEILFSAPKDSVITRRNFSDIKVNNLCDPTYFNYQIPSSAKLIEPDKK